MSQQSPTAASRIPPTAASTRPPTTSEHGLLASPSDGGDDFRLTRYPASDDLTEWVERHWLVRWDLPPGGKSSVTLLPHPCVNLVFDAGRLWVAGVGRDRFTYPLEGQGRVFGVKFRPGAFYSFVRFPVSELTGRTLPADSLWGPIVTTVERALASAGAADDLINLAERLLRRLRPASDPTVETVQQIVQVLLSDRSITRVDDVTRRFGISARSLQRLFQRYVGVSPKWVLRRYRLHEAAARIAEGSVGSWAEVAIDLGYSDQPHFIKDFTAAVGMPPAEYAATCRRGLAPVSA